VQKHRKHRESERTRDKPIARMKVRASVKRLCEFCYTVRRRGKLFVYCKKTPRHKQRQWFGSDAAESTAASASECLSCAAPLAAGAPSFPALTVTPPSLASGLGLMAAAKGFQGGSFGASGTTTLGEMHRQAALLLGGGRR
jgi:large subunit ribosomal protein L36